jgi:hypothetical protein
MPRVDMMIPFDRATPKTGTSVMVRDAHTGQLETMDYSKGMTGYKSWIHHKSCNCSKLRFSNDKGKGKRCRKCGTMWH